MSADPGARVIVLDAAGPAFSAGHDLGEMIGRDMPFFQRLFDVCTELMETIHRLPQPVVAKVQGIATAAGCQLVAACDLAVAADSARFATPGSACRCSPPSGTRPGEGEEVAPGIPRYAVNMPLAARRPAGGAWA